MRTLIVSISLALLSQPAWVTAAEFPDDYYFDQQDGMRSKLEGQPAIEISTDQWIGNEASLDDCQGKVVVLDFWATWCGPCVASIPKNIELVRSHPDDIVFIGMHSETSGWDKAPKMVKDRGINYPVVLDTGETAKAYDINSFPTYIVIDRNGIIRAAGVIPSAVKTIVEELIEESGPSGGQLKFASFNPNWFYSGSHRMKTWQDQLGKPALPILATAWWKPGDSFEEKSVAEDESAVEEPDAESDDADESEDRDEPVAEVDLDVDDDLTGLVRVVHFTRPGMAITQRQLKTLSKTAEQYMPQGVEFAVICDRESDWDQARSFASEIDLGVPMALDASVDIGDEGKVKAETRDNTGQDSGNDDAGDIATKPREAGQTALNYHVRIAPVTVVIDRDGVIRATGLKLEQLGSALDLLLSERTK